MINQTCLTAPTGVPVDVITHCACELEPPFGSCSELPAGQVVETAADADGVFTIAVDTLAPDSAMSPTAPESIAPVRTRCRLILFEIRTSSSSIGLEIRNGSAQTYGWRVTRPMTLRYECLISL